MVTLKDTRARYGVIWQNITQVGSRQLFVLSEPAVTLAYDALLVSYRIPVAYKQNNSWYVTRTRYSVTTTKQLSQFLRGRAWGYTDNI